MSWHHGWALYLVIVPVAVFITRIIFLKKSMVPWGHLQMKKASIWAGLLHYLDLAAESIILLLLVVIMAGPVKKSQFTSVKEKGIDIMFVLDVSVSMQAADFKPNRLEAMKKMTGDFLRRSVANRIGIVIFGKDVFNQGLLTTDMAALADMVDGMA